MARVPVAGRTASSRSRPLCRRPSPEGPGRVLARRGTSSVERLLDIYALEADLYQALLSAAEEEGELLEGDGRIAATLPGDGPRAREDARVPAAGGLAALLAQKDRLLDRIARLEEEAAPLKAIWQREQVPPAHRQRLNRFLDSILSAIDTVVEQERRNEQLLIEMGEGDGHGQFPIAAYRSAQAEAAEPFPLSAVS